MDDKFGCVHPNFDEDGVCTACKEFYSAERDQHPNDIHPAMLPLMNIADPADALVGMAWWNALPEYSRAAWLTEANSAVPADAWGAYKRTLTHQPTGEP